MTIFEVRFSEAATEDLAGIFHFILEGTASPRLAREHTTRLRTLCDTLADFPYRGLPREDIRLGLRLLPVERHSVIAYVIEGETVIVTNFFHAGQDFDALLRGG